MIPPQDAASDGALAASPSRLHWMARNWQLVAGTCGVSALFALAAGLLPDLFALRWAGGVAAALVYPLPATALVVVYAADKGSLPVGADGFPAAGAGPGERLQAGYRVASGRYAAVLVRTLVSYAAVIVLLAPFGLAWVRRTALDPLLLGLLSACGVMLFALGLAYTFVVPMVAALGLPASSWGSAPRRMWSRLRLALAATPVAPFERLFGRVPILAGVALPPGPLRSLLLMLSLAAALPLAFALTAGADLVLADAGRRAAADVREVPSGPAV